MKETERDLQKFKSAQLTSSVDGVIGEGRDIGPFRLWTYRAPEGVSAADLRELALRGRATARPDMGVGMVGATVVDGRAALISVVNPRAQELGLTARALLDAALPAIDGRGGGKDDIAQGGGPRPDGLDEAFGAVQDYVASLASGSPS